LRNKSTLKSWSWKCIGWKEYKRPEPKARTLWDRLKKSVNSISENRRSSSK